MENVPFTKHFKEGAFMLRYLINLANLAPWKSDSFSLAEAAREEVLTSYFMFGGI